MSIKGFHSQKEEMKRGKARRKRRMGKTNISGRLKWSRSKAFLFSKTTKSGSNHCLTARILKSLFRPTSSGVPYRRGRTMRSAEVDPLDGVQNGDLATQHENCPLHQDAAWASEPTKTCFPFSRKSASTSQEGTNYSQQHGTINQNQTSRRVFVGASKSLVMCLRGRGN